MKRRLVLIPGPAPLSRKKVNPSECEDDQDIEYLGEISASTPPPPRSSVANSGYRTLPINFNMTRRDSEPPTQSPAATTTPVPSYKPIFSTSFKREPPRPITKSIRLSSIRTSSASHFLSPKESQIEKNRRELSVNNFVKWLVGNYKKVRRRDPCGVNPLPLMWKFLRQPEIFMMLKQKVEDISKDTYLMSKNTTVELFRMISGDVLDKCVEADLRAINKTYDAFLAVLDSQGELA